VRVPAQTCDVPHDRCRTSPGLRSSGHLASLSWFSESKTSRILFATPWPYSDRFFPGDVRARDHWEFSAVHEVLGDT
jgi:hypothetical protein